MIPIASRRAVASVLLLAGTLAGCAHRAPQPVPPPCAATDRASELDAIVGLLDRGDSLAASPRIDALLRRDPTDPDARVLRDSLDRDPVALLGPKSFAYTLKPGDTMLTLSGRFLGSRFKSYQLARYNRIAVPAAVRVGTVLRIPGADPAPHPTQRPRAVPRAKAAATPVAVPHIDPAGAREARTAGLAALGRGRIDAAVVSLRRAAMLNPDDPLIRRDLARAEHVATAMRARRH